MAYDEFGRTPEQAKRDRDRDWAEALLALLFAAILVMITCACA